MGWWFGFLESPYERVCYLGVPLESQTTNPNQQLTISWSNDKNCVYWVYIGYSTTQLYGNYTKQYSDPIVNQPEDSNNPQTRIGRISMAWILAIRKFTVKQTPWKINGWNPKIEAWKMIFLWQIGWFLGWKSRWLIFPGCFFHSTKTPQTPQGACAEWLMGCRNYGWLQVSTKPGAVERASRVCWGCWPQPQKPQKNSRISPL